MPITLPTFVAPNELIQSAWGNSVVNALDELDDEKMDKSGGAFTGQVSQADDPVSVNHLARKGYVDTQDALKVDLAGDTMGGSLLLNGGAVRAGTTNGSQFQLADLDATQDAYISFFGAASDINTLNTRTGFVGQFGSVDMEIRAEASGGDVRLRANDDIVFLPDDTERFRIAGTAFLFGKTASDLNAEGVEIFGTGSAAIGSVRSTTEDAALQNVYCRHMASADADTEVFVTFARSSAGTVIGTIDQNSTTGVRYNTTSDARLKSDVGLAERDGLDTIDSVTVRRYMREDGSQHVGMFAQELAEAIPNAVTHGGDDPHRKPWMTDYSNENIVGNLILSVQQLRREMAALKAKP
jgi:hypothetical protein